MYLRLLQLKRQSNTKLRKKMVKAKTGWLVISMCFIGAGIGVVSTTTSAQAADVPATDTSSVQNPSDVIEKPSAETIQTHEESTTNNDVSNQNGTVNTPNINEGTNTDESPAPTKPDDIYNDSSAPVYATGSNTTSTDGSISSDLNYNNQTYKLVNGTADAISPVSTDDGSSTIYVKPVYDSIYKPQISIIILKLDAPANYAYPTYALDDDGSYTIGQTLTGNSSWQVLEVGHGADGNTYYNLSSNAWVKSGHGVSAENIDDNLNYVSGDYYFQVIDNYKEVTSKPAYLTPTADANGNLTGSISVHSDYYNKDFTYNYSGKPGTSVQATLSSDESNQYILPKVNVSLASKTITNLDPNSTIHLNGANGAINSLYDDNLRLLNRGIYGQTDNPITAKMQVNNNTYYRTADNEWLLDPGDGSVTTNISGEGTSSTVPFAEYTVATPITKDVVLKTNLDDSSPLTVSNVSGIPGTDTTITVPDVDGYTHAQKTIKAHVNVDNTITPLEEVTYTKVAHSGGSNSGSSDVDSNTDNSNNNQATTNIKKINLTVGTYPDRPDVTLYDKDGKEVTNRVLAPNTNWLSDQFLTLVDNDGIPSQYYRVATNEYIKIADAYVYKAKNGVVKTLGTTRLYNSHGKLVGNRELATNSGWRFDKASTDILPASNGSLVTNNGDYNGELMYRVATNEWVKASDIAL